MPPKAVLDTLAVLWLVLGELKSEIAVAGGVALSFWGNPRSTRAVDLTLMAETFAKLKSLMIQSGFVDQSPSRLIGPFELSKFKFEPAESFVEVEFDILAGKDDYFRQAIERAITANIEGLTMPLRFLTREDLIVYKLFTYRLIDQADILNLMELHWAELDHDYLNRWTKQLKLNSEFDAAVRRFRELNPG